MNRIPTLLASVVLLLAGAGRAAAERYLTLAEAQKICFPLAGQFIAQTNRLAPDQLQAIERQSGVKPPGPLCRYLVARQGTNLLGVLVLDQVFGKHELIDYAAAIAPDGRVLQVELLEYRENYGGEIRGEKWRAQFRGKTAAAPLKLSGDIYNISGATISCRHVTEGVKRVLATFELVIKPKLSGTTGQPAPAP